MHIVLDPSEGGTLYLLRAGAWERFSCSATRAPELLPALVKILSQNDLTLNDVQGFGVVVGKGTFTSTRVAITLGNTLAFSRGISVAALREVPEPSLFMERYTSGQGKPYVTAVYSGEPRIHLKPSSV